MPDGNGAVTARVIDKIADIPAATWDSLAGPDNPFVSYAFLNALEETGCATQRAGWLPHHLVVEDENSRIIAAAPSRRAGTSTWAAKARLRARRKALRECAPGRRW